MTESEIKSKTESMIGSGTESMTETMIGSGTGK